MEVTITKNNFEAEVLRSEIPVLVDFWATWCGPCRMLAPVISEIAEEYAGTVKVGKVNVDEEPELAMQFRVDSIPTVMLFKEGRLVNTTVGFRPKEQITAMLR
ncbi:MAG: thioredoxin [Faecousia sp.]